MLSDSTPEKSKSALRKVRRQKNRVVFIAPTYIEPSDVEWSSDEDEYMLEGDSSLVHDAEMEDSYYNDSYQEDEQHDYKHYQQDSEDSQDGDSQLQEPEQHDIEIQGLGIQDNVPSESVMYNDGVVQEHPGELDSKDDLTVKPLTPQPVHQQATVDQPPSPIEKDAIQPAVDNTTAEGTTTDVPETQHRFMSSLEAPNRDSFYEDDAFETKKISLTPGLLRDDGTPFASDTVTSPEITHSVAASVPASAPASAPASTSESAPVSTQALAAASNHVPSHSDSDLVNQNPTDENSSHDSDKKKKEKKSGLISGLFKRKDKKHHHDDDRAISTDSSKHLSTTLSRESSASASKNSLVSSSSMISRDEEEKKEKENVTPTREGKTSSEQRSRSRANSQIGPLNPHERATPVSNLSKALPERPTDRPSSEPSNNAPQEQEKQPSLSAADPPSTSISELTYLSPSGVTSSSFDSPIDQLGEGPRSLSITPKAPQGSHIAPSSAGQSGPGDLGPRAISVPLEQQAPPANPELPSQSRPIQPIQQMEPSHPPPFDSPEADNFSWPRSPVKGIEKPLNHNQNREEDHESLQPLSQVKPPEPTTTAREIAAPATTETRKASSSPSASSSSLSVASQPAEPSKSQQHPQLTWNDVSLRTYLGDEPGNGGVRDLFILVLNDKGNIAPAGHDHPVMKSLYIEENKALKDMNNRLDDLMYGWLGRKEIV